MGRRAVAAAALLIVLVGCAATSDSIHQTFDGGRIECTLIAEVEVGKTCARLRCDRTDSRASPSLMLSGCAMDPREQPY